MEGQRWPSNKPVMTLYGHVRKQFDQRINWIELAMCSGGETSIEFIPRALAATW